MAPETTSCCERLMEDHRETEGILAQMQAVLDAGDLARLKRLFQTLKEVLDLHFACEEHGLFPVLNQYRTMMLMEIEHDDLLTAESAFADALSDSLVAGNTTPELISTFTHWSERLHAHILEEDRGIFTRADSMLEPEERLLVARKIDEVIARAKDDAAEIPALNRPTPTITQSDMTLTGAPAKPIAFDRRFDVDHASLSHIQLQAGQKLARHWAAEHQCLVLISGQAQFITDTESITLTPGQQLNIEPRFLFALEAEADTHILLFRVWPKPHFLRA
jgi:hemerythrin-like domain-containing protein